MKKFMLFCMVALACLMMGCSKKAATFTVGFDASFPPYGFKNEATGDYIGFDLDLAQEVCNRNGWILEKKPIDWAAKDSELNSGTIDCIWNGFTMSEERKDKYTWTVPYVKNLQVVLVRKNSPIKTLKDLNGKIIVSQDGSSGADAIKSYGEETAKSDATFAFKELKLVPDYLGAAMMLKSKAVDAIALDSAVAGKLIENNAGEFVLLNEKLCDELYAVGFKLGNTALRDKVQATLLEMVKDGTAAKIVNRWATEHKDDDGAKINFILGVE